MMTSENSNQTSIQCNDLQNDQELIKYYDEWAKTYDQDTANERRYVAPEVGAMTLHEFLKNNKFGTDCRILDVGSGTGLVAEHLSKLNYTNIDALDPSKVSNDIARSKNIYQNIIEECFEPGKEICIPSNTYNAAIAIGVFTKGHIKGENNSMEEMVRVVKPGGLICFSIREDIMFDKEYSHEEKMQKMCESKAWKLLLNSKKPYHLAGDCFSGYMFVYEVL